jgi:hypothetical protein
MLVKIYTAEVPLGNISSPDFIDLVVKHGIRPMRPRGRDAPHLSDSIWQIAEQCWINDPLQRPSARRLGSDLLYLSVEYAQKPKACDTCSLSLI